MAWRRFCRIWTNSLERYTLRNKKTVNTLVFSNGIFWVEPATDTYHNEVTVELEYITTIKTISLNKNCLAEYENLKTLVLTDDVESIDDELEGCAKLENLVLSDGVESISEDAFANCTKLKNIYFEASEIKEEWTELFDGYNCYFYSEEPIYDGLHWHYNKYETEPVIWEEE